MKHPATISFKQRIALELERRIRKNEQHIHPLHQLFWECTLRCNLKCKHCGSDCKATSQFIDMPSDDFLKAIDSITPHVNTHELFIIFTGGETLMRKDLELIGKELNQRQYAWGIVSNGLILTPERLISLIEAGMHSITISLDGLKEDHNWMRGNSLSFEHASTAIKMLAQCNGLTWDVVTCVNKRNFSSLNLIKDYLYDIGVRRWRIFTIFPVGRAAKYPEFRLNKEEFTSLMNFISATREEGKIDVSYGCEGFMGKFEGKVRNQLYRCNAGITVGSILADGNISGCPSIRYKFNQGNIYKDDFWEVWQNGFKPFRNREWARKGECSDCSMFRYCEGNGMHLHDENGNLMLCHYNLIET